MTKIQANLEEREEAGPSAPKRIANTKANRKNDKTVYKTKNCFSKAPGSFQFQEKTAKEWN